MGALRLALRLRPSTFLKMEDEVGGLHKYILQYREYSTKKERRPRGKTLSRNFPLLEFPI